MENEKYLFMQTTNVTTGKQEWVAEKQEDHDYFTDIARSSYADMLHDTERNQLYNAAIVKAVASIHARGETCKVLDIGTGTGLLSMMAARAGAEKITAIEVFPPVAEVARRITAANGFSHIKIINKHSNEVTLGENGDMTEKANIIITELFDTELIGEGALSSYQYAHRHLVEENCIAVPHSAQTIVQVVESDLMLSWHKMLPIQVKNSTGNATEISPNPELCSGSGVPAVHDIQLSQFPLEKLVFLTDPVEVFTFDWSSKKLTDKTRNNNMLCKAMRSGNTHAVLSWWNLSMDPEGKIILSTAPHWQHPHGKDQAWRDHWMQSVYFLPETVSVSKGDNFTICASHDDYSFWFSIKADDRPAVNHNTRPLCEYPPRLLWSRARCAMVNDSGRNSAYVTMLKKALRQIPADGLVVCVSDFSLLPLVAASMGVRVGVIEQTEMGKRGLLEIARHNSLHMDVSCSDLENLAQKFADKEIRLLVAEPFFKTSYLPWHDLFFWYLRSQIHSSLHPDCKFVPQRAHLRFAAVQFRDLWKIRAPVGTVEGFDVSLMDRLIDSALEMKEYYEAEVHALWEYPNVLLTKPATALTFDFTERVPAAKMQARGSLPMDTVASRPNVTHCHAAVLWMEYELGECGGCVSNGWVPGERTTGVNLDNPSWYMHQKQAVFFLKRAVDLRTLSNSANGGSITLDYQVTFLPESGEMKMHFDVS